MELIRGYRIWGLVYVGGSFRLYSLAAGSVWEKEMVAVCLEDSLEQHLKEMKHVCGLYSYKKIERMLEDLPIPANAPDFPVCIGGAIVNYGIVAEYTEGYRSSHAIIDTIFTPVFDCDYCLVAEFGGDDIIPATFVFAGLDYPFETVFACHVHQWLAGERFRERGIGYDFRYVRDLLGELSRYYDAPLSPLPGI